MSSDMETQQPESSSPAETGQPNAGAPIPPPTRTRYEDKSVAALVLGLVGLIPFVGIVTGILAIKFGKNTMNGIKAGDLPITSKGMSVAGFVLGIVTLVGAVFSIIGLTLILVFGETTETKVCYADVDDPSGQVCYIVTEEVQ